MLTAEEAWEREEEKLVKRSEVRWKTGVFLLGQLVLPSHAAGIDDEANNRENSLIKHWELNGFDCLKKTSGVLLSTVSQQKILRKIQAHCDILESTGIICSSLETVKHFASCGMPVKTNHAHFLTHFFFCFSVFTHRLNFVLRWKEDKNTKRIIYIIHMHPQKTMQTHAIGCYIHLGFESKMWTQMHKHTKKEASIIKASVGPGERRSLFRLPSCLTGITVYSSVAVTASYVLGTRVAWPCWS